MDKSKINPEALKLFESIRSGSWLVPVKRQIYRFRWFLVLIILLISFFLAISLGNHLSRLNSADKFTVPSLEINSDQDQRKSVSIFDSLKKEIQNFSPLLPDPAIPEFENNVNLQEN